MKDKRLTLRINGRIKEEIMEFCEGRGTTISQFFIDSAIFRMEEIKKSLDIKKEDR